MARSRNIKPGFFENDLLAEIDPLGRLLFAGLWTIADREGRLEDRVKKIKAKILPYDDCDVDHLLDELAKREFILRYEVDGNHYIQITNFLKHQNPHHMEAPSEIPPPEGVKNKFKHRPVTKEQRERIFERDGYKCVICGSEERLSLDHIVPISQGGTSEDNNLRVLCETCNSKKGNLPSIENESSTNREQVDIESSTGREQFVKIDSCPTDSLNLIPDSFNPQTIKKDMSAGAESQSPEINPPLNHKKEAQEVMNFYNQQFYECWSSPLKFTTEREKHIRARLKNFSVDDLKKAIVNLRASPFHCGENDKGKVYATPEFLFKNDSQVDKWLKEITMKGGGSNGRPAEHQPDPEELEHRAELERIAEASKRRL